MDPQTIEEIKTIIFAAGFANLSCALVGFEQSYERAKFNGMFDERIKSYQTALEDLKHGRYSRHDHEEAKREEKEIYDRYMDKSKPFEFVEYADLQKYYENEIRILNASKRRKMNPLEWMLYGPAVELTRAAFGTGRDKLSVVTVPVMYASPELVESDKTRVRRAYSIAQNGIDLEGLQAEILARNAPEKQ